MEYEIDKTLGIKVREGGREGRREEGREGGKEGGREEESKGRRQGDKEKLDGRRKRVL